MGFSRYTKRESIISKDCMQHPHRVVIPAKLMHINRDQFVYHEGSSAQNIFASPETRNKSVTTVRACKKFPKKNHKLFIGIDLGSQGVRLVAVTEEGVVESWRSVPLDKKNTAIKYDVHEQHPHNWWNAVCRVTKELTAELDAKGYNSGDIAALAVDGTSGTVVALDAKGEPVRPAIMYNDPRADKEAEQINALSEGKAFCKKLGYKFTASFALAKMLWFHKYEPERFARTEYFVHQADYIVGCFTNNFGVSDYSNALKTGYDLVEGSWPQWINNWSGILNRLPRVVPPASVVGHVQEQAASQTGLPEGLPVISGATDGTAAFLASGAKEIGDCNTTLGTTLVFKSISRKLCTHPKGLIYCHKLPGDFWLPGAASNTGGEWIAAQYPQDNLRLLDVASEEKLPCRLIAYPLMRKGERFPFLSADAEGFLISKTTNRLERYAAYLQGTAFVERLALQLLEKITKTPGKTLFSTGAGSKSNVWMQCRSDVLRHKICRPACPHSAFGGAVLAAAGTIYSDIWQAISKMVHIEAEFLPNPDHSDKYEKLFNIFCGELIKRGYL